MKRAKPIPRPGGRSARIRASVEEAVLDLLRHKPQAEVGIAEIAERSGVHAASIYRRWGTVEGLLLDLTIERLSRDSPMPDTGTLEGDLVEWGLRLIGPPGEIPLLLRVVMQAKPADRAMLLRRAEQIQVVLDRGAARGEPQLAYTDVVDGLVAPIFIRQIFGIGGVDEALVRTFARRTIASGKPSRRR